MATGDLLSQGAGGIITAVVPGASGTVLTSNGAGVASTFQSVAGTGDVVGPASVVDDRIVTFDGTTGKLIQDGGDTIAGVISTAASTGAAAAIAAILPVDLAADVTGDLPFANLTPATAASKLLGRGDSGAGDFQEITLGANLAMTGTTLSATAGGSGTVTTTGSPANGNLTKFTGATSISNADLTGDVTTSGGVATTLKTAAKTRALGIVVNEGAVPSTGFKGESYVPYACTITEATLLADAAGDIEFDIFAVAYGSYTTPGAGSSIVASAPPTLTNAIKSQDTTLTGWTTSISAGTVLSYEITGVPDTVTRVGLTLTVTV